MQQEERPTVALAINSHIDRSDAVEIHGMGGTGHGFSLAFEVDG
jgi:hypothetical protein